MTDAEILKYWHLKDGICTEDEVLSFARTILAAQVATLQEPLVSINDDGSVELHDAPAAPAPTAPSEPCAELVARLVEIPPEERNTPAVLAMVEELRTLHATPAPSDKP